MFPRSGFLLADSKSNSSTRLPLRTNTRVSSGWEASMIILLDMENSQGARPSQKPRGSHQNCEAWARRAGGWGGGNRAGAGAAGDPHGPANREPLISAARRAGRRGVTDKSG